MSYSSSDSINSMLNMLQTTEEKMHGKDSTGELQSQVRETVQTEPSKTETDEQVSETVNMQQNGGDSPQTNGNNAEPQHSDDVQKNNNKQPENAASEGESQPTILQMENLQGKGSDLLAQSKTNIYFQNAFIKAFIMGTWLIINIFLFFWSFFNFKSDDKFNHMFLMCKDYIFISRATALVINFNCALVLLPMNRVMNSWIQNHLFKKIKTTPRQILDHTKGLHILCAFAICIASVVHTVFHLINLFYFRQNYTEVVKDINIADSKEKTTLWNFLLTIPGWTGVVMIAILAVLVIASLKVIRMKYNEIFRYLHYFYLLFLILATFHGFGNVTKFQTNVEAHPKECHNLDAITDLPQCKEEPKFKHVTPSTWKWIIGPLVLHLIDRIIRLVRSLKTCALVEAKIHNGNVIELVFFKNGFKARPGQYIIVQCPEIAEFEWHPFTLTKCPTGKDDNPDKTFSVHIKVAGNWTSKLLELVSTLPSTEGQLRRVGSTCIVSLDETVVPTFRVDGPFGSPNQDGVDHHVNVSVAAGIGITPYAAVLNYLKHFNPDKVSKNFKLENLHLIWVCKDVNEFSWVVDLIKEVKEHLREVKREQLLHVQLFVTQKYKVNIESQAQMINNNFAEHESGVTDAWFKKNMKQGRPDWKNMLTKIAVRYESQKIGLFYCGAKTLGKILRDASLKVNMRGNTYVFRKESF